MNRSSSSVSNKDVFGKIPASRPATNPFISRRSHLCGRWNGNVLMWVGSFGNHPHIKCLLSNKYWCICASACAVCPCADAGVYVCRHVFEYYNLVIAKSKSNMFITNALCSDVNQVNQLTICQSADNVSINWQCVNQLTICQSSVN